MTDYIWILVAVVLGLMIGIPAWMLGMKPIWAIVGGYIPLVTAFGYFELAK